MKKARKKTNWIYIVRETGKLLTYRMDKEIPRHHGLKIELEDGATIHQDWIDYRINTGTDEAPIWEGRELPEWLTDDTPAKWNGKELVKDE